MSGGESGEQSHTPIYPDEARILDPQLTQHSEFEQHGQIGIHGDTAQGRNIGITALIESLSVHPRRHEDGVGGMVAYDGRGKDHVFQWCFHNLLGKEVFRSNVTNESSTFLRQVNLNHLPNIAQ